MSGKEGQGVYRNVMKQLEGPGFPEELSEAQRKVLYGVQQESDDRN